MKRILLTGGNGFLGRNIRQSLDENYMVFAPSSKELNLLDGQAVTQYIRQNRISDVIHSAVYNQRWRGQNPDAEFSANMKMFFHLAQHARDFDQMIYFGSGAEFDKRFALRQVTEQDFGKSIPLLNDYGLSKYTMNLYARQSENVCNLRLFGVYGPYEDWRTCLISNLCCKAVYGLPLTIRQDCVFDFLYVKDLIRPVCGVLESKPRRRDYNLCSGQPVRLTEIAQMVRRVSQKELEIQILNPGENLEYTGCPDGFAQEYGLSVTPLEQGIQRVYRFYESHIHQIDRDVLRQTR